jgi:hypothetical protein
MTRRLPICLLSAAGTAKTTAAAPIPMTKARCCGFWRHAGLRQYHARGDGEEMLADPAAWHSHSLGETMLAVKR